MLLERGVVVGESIRLSPVWPRSESRIDAIRLSLFFSGSRPCSCSLFRLCFSGCSVIPLCIELQSVRWRIVDERKNNVGLFCHKIIIYLFIYSQSTLNFCIRYCNAGRQAGRDSSEPAVRAGCNPTGVWDVQCGAFRERSRSSGNENKNRATGGRIKRLKSAKRKWWI